MTTHEERQRLAAMANALRPDWPVNSLYTLLTHETVVKRSYRDVALALAWVAADEETRTPARIHDPGPWWTRGHSSEKRAQQYDPMCHTCWEPHDPGVSCSAVRVDHETPERQALRAAARAAVRGETHG